MEAQARYIDGVLGPHEVGVMVAIFLFGLVTIQTFTYFRKYPEDPKSVKVLVGFVWTLLFSHTIISAYSLYRRTVSGFAKMEDLERYPEGTSAGFALSGIIGSTVQSFFAYRLRKLSGRSAVAILCWFLSLVRTGSVICISVTTSQSTSVRQYVDHWAWLVIFSLSISAFVDLMIAGSLSYYLWSRRKDVFKHAQRVVDMLIAWTIQTGVLTSITSILMLVLYASVQNFAWIAAYFVISPMFANFLLASLNSRNSFREQMNRKPTFLDIETLHGLAYQPPLSLDSVTFEVNTQLSVSVDRILAMGR